MIKLFKDLKPYTFQIIILVFLVFAAVAATLQLPDYMAKIINEGIINKNNSLILYNGVLMLLFSLIGVVCTIGSSYLSSKVATAFSRDIRLKVFSHIESFSLTEFNKFSTASLITRSTNDIQQIQSATVMILRMVLRAPIMGIWAIFKAYQLAPSLSWVIALSVIVLLAVVFLMFSIALPKFKILQKLIDRLNLVTRENLTGLQVIRAFNNEKIEEAKFEKANLDLTKVNLFVSRLMVIVHPMLMLILNLSSVLIVWLGAHLINYGNLEIGSMIAFMQYASQVIMAFLMISMIFIMIPRASVSAERINEVTNTEPAIKNSGKPVTSKNDEIENLEFKDVSFTYPDADIPVLENISFQAKSGEVTAFIGSTGSGKSTLINLIPRFYDLSSGEILLDGVDIRDYILEDLYTKIGYVPQKGVLFSGTVEFNIKYGAPEASDDELRRAISVSQSEDFVSKLEGGVKAPIAQGGANISGGQKQRLAIARALIKKPEIYIFDDSFSALDFKTDAKLRQALKDETKDKIVLIVAQRISTIMSAQKIVVLDEGKIVGQGSHEQLLKDCNVYREIAYSQLSEEELESYKISFNNEKVKTEKKKN